MLSKTDLQGLTVEGPPSPPGNLALYVNSLLSFWGCAGPRE